MVKKDAGNQKHTPGKILRCPPPRMCTCSMAEWMSISHYHVDEYLTIPGQAAGKAHHEFVFTRCKMISLMDE
jgi:hypothetical protein